MRLAVIIKAEQKEELPTASELREAGFAVSTAIGAGRDEKGAAGAPRSLCAGREPDPGSPGPNGPPPCPPERQRP